MKILKYAFGLIGAFAFIAVIIGYTQSWWAVLIGALGMSVLCASDKEPERPSVPMVGPRTHDVEDGGAEYS